VTSGLCTDRLMDSVRDYSSAAARYEGFKCSHLRTQDHCRADGLVFIPMVVEASGGGWGSEAAKVWSELAKTLALATGELRAITSARILRSLAIILHRENAHAILRRSPRALDRSGAATAAAFLAGPMADAVKVLAVWALERNKNRAPRRARPLRPLSKSLFQELDAPLPRARGGSLAACTAFRSATGSSGPVDWDAALLCAGQT
jgi:hypothetical protein